ncbi:AAA family ATPase [Hymenobacter nitidus]
MDLLRTRNRERRMLDLCLETQMRCVIDNTNPSRAERAVYIEPALQAGFRVTGYYFHATAAEALVRNEQRTAERQVPPVGIRATRNRLELPQYSEGFDELFFVRASANHTFDLSPWQHEI